MYAEVPAAECLDLKRLIPAGSPVDIEHRAQRPELTVPLMPRSAVALPADEVSHGLSAAESVGNDMLPAFAVPRQPRSAKRAPHAAAVAPPALFGLFNTAHSSNPVPILSALRPPQSSLPKPLHVGARTPCSRPASARGRSRLAGTALRGPPQARRLTVRTPPSLERIHQACLSGTYAWHHLSISDTPHHTGTGGLVNGLCWAVRTLPFQRPSESHRELRSPAG